MTEITQVEKMTNDGSDAEADYDYVELNRGKVKKIKHNY
jgi:hypothetical protein